MSRGDHMKKARNAAGLSIEKLAAKAGVHRDTIFFWEHNRVEPRRSSLKLVTEALGISVEAYVGGRRDIC